MSIKTRPLIGLLAYVLLQPASGKDTPTFIVEAITEERAKEYTLEPSFYKKGTMVQDILIATSERVSDYAHLEAAYQFDMMMRSLKPDVAQRIRDKKVLCILVGHDELTSDVPQFKSEKKGKELDFYNWRQRGFLTYFGGRLRGRPVVLFAEEDVMEYEGGMQLESILIHEFGHVVDGAGFDKDQREKLQAAFQNVKDTGLYMDGRAAQRFRRVESETPVSLLDALIKSFPDQPRALLVKCLDGGDILVNGEATKSDVKVTKEDKVVIVFGGPKECYAAKNRSEYWAEGFQNWYDTNRTMDHDHNHIHTRDQLKVYDKQLAKLCSEVMGESPWKFVSPRRRAGMGHLEGYDPAKAPVVKKLPHIVEAGNDYYDGYWKDYWNRLHEKYPEAAAK